MMLVVMGHGVCGKAEWDSVNVSNFLWTKVKLITLSACWRCLAVDINRPNVGLHYVPKRTTFGLL